MLIAPILPGGCGRAREEVVGVRYRLEVRLTPADVGQRVVIRWRRPTPGDGEAVVDVLGILEEAEAGSFSVRTADGKLVVVPAGRALAEKVVPPPPARHRGAGPSASLRRCGQGARRHQHALKGIKVGNNAGATGIRP